MIMDHCCNERKKGVFCGGAANGKESNKFKCKRYGRNEAIKHACTLCRRLLGMNLFDVQHMH